MNARYYDPAMGQFISPDSVVPTSWAMGMNRYAYAYGDPILYIDPSGHFAVMNIVKVVLGTGEVVIGVLSCAYAACADGTGVLAIINGADDIFSGISGLSHGNTNQPGFLQMAGTAACSGDPNCGIALKLGTAVASMPAGAGLGPALGTLPGVELGADGLLAISATGTVVTAGAAASATAGLASAVTAAGTQSQMSGDRTPGSNTAQNRQFADAVQEGERRIGRKLTDAQVRRIHDAISHENYSYHEIVDLVVSMFGN